MVKRISIVISTLLLYPNIAMAIQGGSSSSDITQIDANNNIASGPRASAGSNGFITGFPNGYGGTGGNNNIVLGSGNSGDGGDGGGASRHGATGGAGGNNNIVLGSGVSGTGGNAINTTVTDWTYGGAGGNNNISIGGGTTGVGANLAQTGGTGGTGGSNNLALGINSYAGNANGFTSGNNGGIAIGSSDTLSTVASGTNSIALGTGSVSSGKNSVSIGSSSIDGGLENVVSVGSSAQTRKIVNVTAGDINSISTDSVNGAQLFITNQAVLTAQTTADSALTNAATAQTTANTAKTTANTAKTTADSALTNAATAQTTANTAKTTADSALTNAATAQTTANTALNNAATANHRIDILDNKFQKIDNRLNKIDTKLDSVGALAAAQSRIPAVIDGSKNYAVSIGIGNYGSKNAMAVGATIKINENIFSSGSFAIADHDSSSSSLGVSFAW